MKKLSLPLLFFCTSFFSQVLADTVVWSGDVDSNGTPTALIPLTLGKQYQVKASGTLNLGKWWQAGKPLEEDAFYEYNNSIDPIKLETLKNSFNLSLNNNGFHPDHVYLSKPFTAAQNGVHFWISDIDYGDNTGKLQVQIIELTDVDSSKNAAATNAQNEISRGGEGRDESLENRDNDAQQRGNQRREQRLNNEQQNSEGRQQNRDSIARGGGGGGEGRDENLENREDNAEDNDNPERADRLNDELDNSEMRQSERPNNSNTYPPPQ